MDTSRWQATDNEPSYRAYGSTGNNMPSSAPKTRNTQMSTNAEDVDIQLHDFKGLVYNEPLIVDGKSQVASDVKPVPVRPTSFHTRLTSHSSVESPHSPFSETSFNQHYSWIKHPKVRENWRVVLASFLLTLLGIGLMITSLVIAITPARGYHCLILGGIGLICIIPGGYHFVYIYCAAIGRPGYEFDNLPVLR